MAYTIQFNRGGLDKRDRVLFFLRSRLEQEGTFKATLTPFVDVHNLPCIKVQPVRLSKAKPYCGNHPGECPIGSPKPMARFLEWDDWVKFHALVNGALGRYHSDADVWSNPPDARGKMWIRKGTKARVKWDWTETEEKHPPFRTLRVWNTGTPDQFA